VAVVEDFFVFKMTYRGQAVTTEDDSVVVSCESTSIHAKSPLEAEVSEAIFAYKCYFFWHPTKFVKKELGHEGYHGSFEALFTEIIASRTEKPWGNISSQGIGYHEDETLSSTSVEKRVMEDEGFWHEKMI
jgi:hypothetical protein